MREKRKNALLFLVLTTSILFTTNFMNPTVSEAADSEPVNLVDANVLWEKTYGGAGDDRAFYATPLADGFLVVGSSTSFKDSTEAWVLRLDLEGKVLWNQTFSEGGGSELRSVLALEDGFLLVGNVFLISGDVDGYAVRINAEAEVIWTVTLGGEKVDKLFSSVESQNGFMMVGLTYSFGNDSEVWVVETDFDGNILWDKTFGGAMEEAGRAIAATEENTYVISGYSNSLGNGDYDFLLMKIDASGNLLWNKTYGGAQSDKAFAIAEKAEGSVVVGDTRSKGEGDNDAWIIIVDSNGNLVWDKTVGGEGFDMPTCVTISKHGGYLVGGFTFSFGEGERDFWLFKFDDAGDVSWSCTVGRSGFEEAYAVLEAAEYEFVMVGWTNSIGEGKYDFYIAKISVDTNGDMLSAYNFIALALTMTVIALVVLVIMFFLIRRYVNQKISRQDLNAVSKNDV